MVPAQQQAISFPANGGRVSREDGAPHFAEVHVLGEHGALILMRYDAALIRGDEEFSRALASGRETTFADQYMYMTPW